MAKNIIVEKIFELSQKEGLNDSEIGDILGYARGSIQRIRVKNQIPKANKLMRKDKACICTKCNSAFFIRRNDPNNKIYLCPTCLKEDGAAYNKMLNDKNII